MSRTPARFTQADAASSGSGFVYFVRIGKHIKIGFSKNVERRMKAFATTSVDIELLFSIPGTMDLEHYLHELFAEIKIRNEIFHMDHRISAFMRMVDAEGLDKGLSYLEEATPSRREQRRLEERNERTLARRLSKAEKDAHFASLVADRKRRIGW